MYVSGNVERNLHLFRELLSCAGEIYLWTYDVRMKLADTSCPEPEALEFFFSLEEQKRLEEVRKSMEAPLPVVWSNMLQMIWIADFETDPDGQLQYTHLIGPVFLEEVSSARIRQQLDDRHLSAAIQRQIMDTLRHLPVVLLPRFMEYGLMLHCCITGRKISVSEIVYADSRPRTQAAEAAAGNVQHEAFPDVHGTWAMEQQMMRMMEEGNLDYIRYAGRIASQGTMGRIGAGDSVRELKNYCIVHITLCRLAAVRGGLSPEIAYALSDRYITGIEGCHSISEIAELNAAMQQDYLTRVHRCRMSSGVSAQILRCCDYIELHLSEKLTLPRLSEWTGYSDTYLSKKFREETGQTISEYIAASRIERAKDLLISTDRSIREICESVGWPGQSRFGACFKKATGMTPGEYRMRGRE